MKVLPERSPDLAALIGVALELARQAEVPEVVDPDATVVGGDENLSAVNAMCE